MLPFPLKKRRGIPFQRELVIFVGLDMGPIEAAREEDTRNTILIAVVFLLIGISGIISLLLPRDTVPLEAHCPGSRPSPTTWWRICPWVWWPWIAKAGSLPSIRQPSLFCVRPQEKSSGRWPRTSCPKPAGIFSERWRWKKQIIAKEIDCSLTDDRTIPLEVIATVLEEEDGARGVVVLFRDITEIKQLKKEIAQSQRLASLGSLAAGVAHEIRNPLSSIKGFATYFKERYRDNPDDSQTADIMVQEVDRLNRVIGQLLDYARPMTMNRRETAIQTVIQHALRMIESQAREKGVVIQIELQADVAAVMIDPDRIKQVFLNLYLNAIGAMEGGGILSVALFSMTDRRIRIEVRDTGVGIDPKDLDRIFDPISPRSPPVRAWDLLSFRKLSRPTGVKSRWQAPPAWGRRYRSFCRKAIQAETYET